VQIDLSSAEQAISDALTAEQAKFQSEYQDADVLPDEIDAHLEQSVRGPDQ